MKKMALLLLVLVLAGAVLSADNTSGRRGTGISIGAEALIEDLRNIENFWVLRPFVDFDRSFGPFDVYANVGFDMTFDKNTGSLNTDYGIDANAGFAFNLKIKEKAVLSFSLGAWIILPFGDNNNIGYPEIYYYGKYRHISRSTSTSIELMPGFKYTHKFNFGDIYFGLDIPFEVYTENGSRPFDFAQLQLTAAVVTKAGFGGGLTFFGDIGRNNTTFEHSIDVFLNFRKGFFFAGAVFTFPVFKDGFKDFGMIITPEIEISFFGFSVYAKLPIFNIGGDRRTLFGLTVGAKYSF